MSKAKKIVLILLLTLPFLISTGLASWIIINVKEDDNPPKYNYETIINNAFNDQDKDYSGSALGPDAMYNGEINEEIIASGDFKFYHFNGSVWVEGLPTDSGIYQIKIVPEAIDDINKGVEITFTINKADQIVSVTGISLTYDGKPHQIDESTVKVVFGNEEGLTITGNTPRTDVGITNVSIAVSGNSNFNPYETTVKVEITKKGINDEDLIPGGVITSYTYDGNNKKPTYSDILLTYNGMTLDSDDYDIISYANNKNATNGTKASVTIQGKNNYDGMRTLYFDIAKANQVVSFASSKIYDGKPASVVVTTNKEVEDLNTTKTVKFYDTEQNEIAAPTAAGKYLIQVTVDGTDNYNDYDSGYVDYEITPLEISNVEIGTITDIQYTNSPITLPVPQIMFNGMNLVQGLDNDYTISYKDINGNILTEIIEAGSYKAIVKGHNNFTGIVEVEFNVVKNAIGEATIIIPDLTYNGQVQTPTVVITDEGVTLVENEHYKLSYATIKDADEYSITITGIGLYEGKVTKSVKVNPADISSTNVSGLENLIYTGTVINVNPSVVFNTITLIEGTDYSYEIYKDGSVSTILEQGKYVLLITATENNFTGTKEVEFIVEQGNINLLTITTNSATYNAENQVPTVLVKNGETVIDESNYVVTYSYTEFINAGTYSLTITAKDGGNLVGSTTVDYVINRLGIVNVDAVYETQVYYTSSQITPDISLSYKGYTLTSSDYEVTYGENTKVGQGSITVTSKDSSNYQGTTTYYFNIVKESLNNVEVTGYEETITYTGIQYTPTITVKLNGVELIKDLDYSVEYGTNVDAGTTTYIKVIGIGIYFGEKEITISIIKANIEGITFDDKSFEYDGTIKVITINGTLPSAVTVEYYSGNVVFDGATDVDDYLVTAKFTVNNSNYNDLDDLTATLTIYKAAYDMSSIKFENNSVEYNAETHELLITGTLPYGVTVKYYVNELEFNGAKDQGIYQVTAIFSGDSTNYEAIPNMTATLTITKATPIITVTSDTHTVDYNSSLALNSNYIITNNPDNIVEVITITNSLGVDVTNESILSAGTYTVTITLTGNSNVNTVTEEFTLVINKIDPVYTVPTNLIGIYGNELQSITLPDGWTFVNPTAVMNNIGDYETSIKYTPADTINYNIIIKDIVVDVQKATISGITFSDKVETYNGLTHTIEIEGTLPTGVTVKYYYDDEEFTGAIKHGTYDIIAKFTDTTGNYEAIADMNAKLTINKASYDMTGVTFVNKTVNYNGSMHLIILTGTLPLDLAVEYYIGSELFEGKVNAGTYLVTAKFKDTSDGGNNYNLPVDMNATLTINQIVDPNYVEQGNLTANYLDTLATISSQLLPGWSFVNDLDTLVGNEGSNTFTVVFTSSDEVNYITVEKEIAITVSAIDPTFTVNNNTYTYDGTSKFATVTSVSEGTITVTYKLDGTVVDNPTAAGNYEIYVSITKADNYNALTEYKLDAELIIDKYQVTEDNSSISSIANQNYTGSEIKPAVTVTLNENIPFDADCYTIAYTNNIERGEATVTITLIGNFEGTLTTTFNIVQGSITDESISSIENRTYTGKETIYDLIVTVSDKVLTKDTDYTVSVTGDIINVGTVTITVTGTGNYSGSGTVSFDITPVDIKTCKEIIIPSEVYKTSGNTPLPTVEVEGLGVLVNEIDYTLDYQDNIGVTSNAKVIITGTGNYTGELTVKFVITAKDISDIVVDLVDSIIYTGNEIKPISSVTLAEYSDLTYDVTYTNNTNAGINTSSYTITGTGNFSGTVTENFTINPFDLSTLEDDQVELIGSLVYTSKQIKPTANITFNNDILDTATYSLTYGENINVADGGTVTINAVSSNFKGSKEVSFEIEERTITDAIAVLENQAYTGAALTPVPTITIDGIGTLSNVTDFTLEYSGDNVNVTLDGVTVTIKGTGNYKDEITVKFNITPIDITDATVSEIENQYYTGNEVTPKPIVKVGTFGILSEGTDYDVTYENNIKVGTATITITAKGNYVGTVTKEFNIIDSIASATVYFGEETTPADVIYNSEKYTPIITKVIINGVELVLGTHYEVTYGENTNAGTGYVYITALPGSGYEGAKEITFDIAKATQTINFTNINETYSGTSLMISATSNIGSAITYYDEDGNIFTGVTDAGTYKVIIKASGNSNYEEALEEATITISAFDINNLVINTNIIGFQDKVVYNGSPIVQDLSIVFNSTNINDLLTISQNNQDPTDSAKIYITVNDGVTNFTGSKELTFAIDKANQEITAIEEVTVVYGNDYEIEYTKLGDGNVTITYYNSKDEVISKPVNVGNYYAQISVEEGSYHYAGSKEVTITITAISPTIEITKNIFDYDAEAHYIEYTSISTGIVTVVYKDVLGVEVVSPTKVGTYTVTLTQEAAGNYTESTVNTTLTINAIKPVINITNITEGKMTFDYNQVYDMDSYITISNNPDGLDYVITYNGLSAAPSIPGECLVVVKVLETENTLEAKEEFTLVINKIDAVYEGETIFTATYKDKLSTIELLNGLTWNNPDTEVGVATTTGHTYYATYNPDEDLYNSIQVALTVKVNKAQAEYTGSAITLEAYYGNKLADIKEDLPENFRWKDESLSVGTVTEGRTFTAYYNPDSNNYLDDEVEITVVVKKVQAVYDGEDVIVNATYGQTLANITLPAYFTWVDDSLNVGDATSEGRIFVAYYNNDPTNLSDVEVEVTVIVAKAKLDKPTIDTTEFTYNKEAQTYTPNGYVETTMNIEGNVQTNAGTHKVTVSIKDTANYEWEDGTITDVTFNFVIGKAQLTIPTTDTTEFTYNKEAQTYTPNGYVEATMNVKGNVQTNAGTHIVTVSIKDTANYEWKGGTITDVTFNFVIGKATPVYEGVKELTKVYGTVLSSIVIEGITWLEPSAKVGDVNTSPNKHTATYNPDVNNYNDITVEFSITVTKATQVYEGEAVVLEAYYGQKLADITEDLPTHFSWVNDTLSVGSANTIGSFTAYYNPDSANYNDYEVTITVKVNKAQAEYTGSVITLTAVYGQTLADISAKLPTYFSWVDDALSVGNANTTGSFTAYYNPDSNNYISDEVTVKVTVSKATEAYNGSTEITTTYVNGQTLSDLALPDIKLRWADGTKEVGNATIIGYTFTAYYNPDSANYNDYEVTITVKVNKADLSTISIVGKSVDYNGNVQSLILSTTLPSDLGVTFVNNEQTNSGTYKVTATITGSIDNYILPDKLEATLQINRISPTVSNFEDLNVSLGDEYNIIPSVLGINGDTVNYEIKYYDSSNNLLAAAPTVNGTYIVKLIVDETNYEYNGSIELIISNPIKIVVTGTGDTGVDYDGNGHEASIAVYNSNDENITTNVLSVLSLTYTKDGVNYVTPVDAGKYSVVVTCTDSINYTITSDSITEATIIINKLNVLIDFEYDYSGSDYRYKSKEYTGSVISLDYTISGISENLIASDFVVRIYNGNNAVVDIDSVLSIDTYRYVVEFNETNYNLSGYSVGILAITKAKIILSNTVIEIAYGEITHSYEKLFVKVEELLSFVMYNDNTKSVVIDAVLNNINDGKNVYTSSSTTSLIGNTYSGSISFTSSIYQLVDESGNSMNSGDSNLISIIVKYKTAKVGDYYYTIEDALKQSGIQGLDILLAANATSYIQTSFTYLDYYKEQQDYEQYFTLDGQELIVPIEEGVTDRVVNSGYSDVVSSVLLIPNSIEITLMNSAILTVGGQIVEDGIVQRRAVVMNDGVINVQNGCYIYSYGYIKQSSIDSNGIINLESGANAIDCMRVFDWPGGNSANEAKNKLFPTNAWSFHNISCSVKIIGSAVYQIYVRQSGTGFDIKNSYPIVNGTNPLYRISNESSYILKKAINADLTPNDNKLYSIDGSNQTNGQKDTIELNGEFTDNAFSVDVTGITLSVSKSKSINIGFMDIIINKGKLTLSNSDYVLMPGTSILINDDAELVVNDQINISLETWSNVVEVGNQATNKSIIFSNYCVDKVDAEMIIKGKLTANSGSIFGGLIKAGKENVTLDLTKITLTTKFVAMYNAVGAKNSGNIAYSVSSFPVYGNITSSNSEVGQLSRFTNSTYTSTKIGEEYYWVGENGGTNLTGTIKMDEVKYCLVEGTLITMADGTQKKVEDVKVGDLLLVFNHETGIYDVTEVLFNDTETISYYTVINLEFSNGSIVKVVSEHGFFDLELMKYVYIDEYNYMDYIGHRFVSTTIIDGEVVQGVVTLDKAYLTEEYVRVYSPVTKYHLNYVTENILSMPGGVEGIFNIFEYDDNLQYNQELMHQDIEKYGLFTYEDFQDLVSYEIYCSFPTQYFKVAIGKGILTWEDLYYYIERYAPLM